MIYILNNLIIKRIIDFKSYCISLFILLLPFIYSEVTLEPVLKIRFLSFSFLVFALSVLSIKGSIEKEIYKHPIILSFLLMFFFYIISTIFNSVVVSEAIFSTLKLGVFIVFLINIIDVIKDDSCRRRIFTSISIFSFFCCLLYVYQYINHIIIDEKTIRIEELAATMSNKNLLSSALFLTIPFNFYNLNSNLKSIKLLSLTNLILIPIICFIIFSKATLIAVFFLLLSVLFLKYSTQYFSKIFYYSIISFLILCFTSLILISTSNSDNSQIVKSQITKYSNSPNLFKNKRGSFSTRIHLYENTLDLILNNLILGVGPGNWKVQHGKYSLYQRLGENGRKIVQRPHNDFLWIASEVGIIAGIIFLFIFMIALKYSHKNSYNNNEDDSLFKYSVFGVLLGYFFISSFDFPSERLTHNFLFFLLLSYVISTSLKSSNNFFKKNVNRLIWCFSFLIITSFLYVSNSRYKGEKLLAKVKFYKGKNNWQKIIRNIDNAYIPYIYELDRSGTPIHWYSGIANFSLNKFDDAFEDFKLAYQFNPYHLHVLNNIGTIYQIKGHTNKAIEKYNTALQISPRFEEASVNLAAVLFNQQKIQESLDVILRCNIEKDIIKYDKYLKTIFLKLINNYFEDNKLNPLDEKKILSLKKLLNNDFNKAKVILRDLYEIRKKENNHYLDLHLNYIK